MIVALLLSGCSDGGRPPAPSFEPIFPPLTGDLMTISSPVAVELDGDSVLDLVFGAGVQRTVPIRGQYIPIREPAIPGYVVAVSGATNKLLWNVPHAGDAFTIARFLDVNRDRVPDVIMGGREAALSALSGVDGKMLWQVTGESIAKTPVPYNFFTPALIRDANGDGMQDIVVIYGGDDTRLPRDPRDPGFIAVISGADGAVLKVYPAHDGKELYSSPIVYQRSDGTESMIFGSGGEVQSGGAYRVPVAALLDGSFASRVETVLPPGEKGVMAPPVLLQLNDDAELDIVITTFDGKVAAIDGATLKPIWQHVGRNEETYHPAAVVRMNDGKLGLFVSEGIGVFPKYIGSAHRLHDAATGRIVYEYRDPNYPAGAPLAADLNGDDVDEPVFFSTRFPSAEGARIHIVHLKSGQLHVHEVKENYWSTPLIADLRGSGNLELIGLSWTVSNDTAAVWRGLKWQLQRMNLNAKTPAHAAWAGYMGTRADGHYRKPE